MPYPHLRNLGTIGDINTVLVMLLTCFNEHFHGFSTVCINELLMPWK